MGWEKRRIKTSGPLTAPSVPQTNGAEACPYGRKKCCSRMSASVIVQSELSCGIGGNEAIATDCRVKPERTYMLLSLREDGWIGSEWLFRLLSGHIEFNPL